MVRSLRHFVCALLVACGRSGLEGGDGSDDAGAGDARASSDDAGVRFDVAHDPPPAVDDAGTPAVVVSACDLAPALAPGCPAVEPRPGGACSGSTTCAYSRTGPSGTTVAIYACVLLGEDLIGWKESEVPCARECLVDAGGTPLDASGCTARETVPCVPPPGETAQTALDDQIFWTDCIHREGAGGFTVHFDSQGCAIMISGGTFSACDVAALTAKRFACAEGHPCATAVTLVK